MKKYLLLSLCLLLTLGAFAQNNRNVIIETFTGRNSGYDPEAHKVANELVAANPGRVFPINIHGGSFSPTSYPNLNTNDGTEILTGFNVGTFPSGNINRDSQNALGRNYWEDHVNTQLNQTTEVDITGDVVINSQTRVAEISINLNYVSNSSYETNFLTIMMLQDSIWGSQSGGSSNPEQYVNGQYCHMHVLRDIITPTWGDPVVPTTAGTIITKTYAYEIPEIIGDQNGVDVDLNNIYFLAFVTETYQGTPTRPVLNVAKIALSEGVDCGSPENLAYTIDDSDINNVKLSWTAPENAENVTYEIYSNGSNGEPLYEGITDTTFTIVDLPMGDYALFVKAIWNEDCLSVASNPVEFTVIQCLPEDKVDLTFMMAMTNYYSGWQGGYIEVVGTSNNESHIVELKSGYSGEITLSLCPDIYDFIWHKGNYDRYVSFTILCENTEVFSVAKGDINSSFDNNFLELNLDYADAYISNVVYDSDTITCSSERFFDVEIVNSSIVEITSVKLEASVSGGEAKTCTWEGSIPAFESSILKVSLDILGSDEKEIEVKIVELNGIESEDIYTISVNVIEIVDTYVNGNSGEYTIDIRTGYCGGGITWELLASDGSVLATGGPYDNTSYQPIHAETISIPAGECVKFVIRNKYSDYNSVDYTPEYYRIIDGKGNVVVFHKGRFGAEKSYQLSAISDENMDNSYAENTFNVNVDVPGTLSYKLAEIIEHWSDVYVLKITGELNSTDFDVYSKLTHLMTLDLTQTNITSISGLNGLRYLRDVYLPETVVNIDNRAFYDCFSLASINIPNVTSLGYYAFNSCYSLTSIDISNVTEFSYYNNNNNNYGCCFNYCVELCEVILSEELTYIPQYFFYNCSNLTEISLPASLKTIEGGAFYRCGFKNIDIPEGVITIGSSAFNTCPLETISIPSTVLSIGTSAFYESGSLTDVYCHVAVPINAVPFRYDGGVSTATLHVPEFSEAAYRQHNSWYNFGNIVPMEQDIEYVYINTDFTIVNCNGLADNADLTLDLNAHLTVTAGSEFNLNNYKQITSNTEYYEYDNNWNYTYYYPSTLITYNEMNADNVEVSLVLRTDRWNFISLPFDVNVSDITYPEGTLWVVRKYSGEDRANMTGNTWHNMTDGMTLNAGEGYILHCDHANNSYVTFTFPAVNNESMNNMLSHEDIELPLEIYPSEYVHNSSWNLVGNPYPSYFNTNGNIEYNGIITVWDNGYVAYSLLDDYFTLKPYESFFVQCHDDESSMLFKTEGRSHTNDYDDYSKRDEAFRQRNSGDRKIYNFTLNNEEYSDRTRLVLNEAASVDYELSCDASKFMNEDENVPQIYVYDNEVMYAINERPLGLGVMSLGIRIGQAGEYTLALDPKEEYNEKVVLYDNETGEEIDILNESYTFFAEEGYDDDRFVLSVTGNTIGIEENVVIDINDSDVEVYDIYGRRVRVSDAKNGLYILKKDDKVQKCFINE